MTMIKNEAGNSLPTLKEFTFNPNNAPIRVQMINQEPWFVAKDVCDALGLTDTGKTVERLDDDEKLTRIVFVSGQNRQMWHVNESGLYNLIFQSRKPEAKVFRKWVTSEVLPSIRKTGMYMPQKSRNTPVRYRKRENFNVKTLQMLWLVGENLMRGDQKDIALELGVTVQAVCGVLNGSIRSPRILNALYERALSNHNNCNLYATPEKVIATLEQKGGAQ